MCDDEENIKSKKQLNSSKELLYSDITGTTVVQHVLSSLEKPKDLSVSEEINKFKRKREKSEAFERVKKLLCEIDEGEKGNCVEAPIDDEEAIDVHLTIGEESSDTKTENFKADAWFILPQSKTQESGECLSNLLEISDCSSDCDLSDNESLPSFPISRQKKNLVIEDVSPNLEDECKL